MSDNKQALEVAAEHKKRYGTHTNVYFLANAYEVQARQLAAAVEGLEKISKRHNGYNDMSGKWSSNDATDTLTRIKEMT